MPSTQSRFLGTLKELLSCFKFQKPVTAFRAWKSWSLFWCGVRYQKLRSTLWLMGAQSSEAHYDLQVQPLYQYSPCRHHSCNDRGSTVYRYDRAPKEEKRKKYFRRLVALYHLSLQFVVAAGGVSAHGLYRDFTTRIWGFGSALYIKRLHLFLALNALTIFLTLKSRE